MRVVIYKQHLKLDESLAKESNLLAKKFSSKSYSRVENIGSLLLKRDISVEKKKIKNLTSEYYNRLNGKSLLLWLF